MRQVGRGNRKDILPFFFRQRSHSADYLDKKMWGTLSEEYYISQKHIREIEDTYEKSESKGEKQDWFTGQGNVTRICTVTTPVWSLEG